MSPSLKDMLAEAERAPTQSVVLRVDNFRFFHDGSLLDVQSGKELWQFCDVHVIHESLCLGYTYQLVYRILSDGRKWLERAEWVSHTGL